MRKLCTFLLLAIFGITMTAAITGCEAEVGDPGPNGIEVDLD